MPNIILFKSILEHFLDEAGSVKIHPESYIPFSIGYRSCLGESLAKSKLFLLFTWLIQSYEISKVPGKENVPLIEINPFDAMAREPKPYEVVIKKRSNKE